MSLLDLSLFGVDSVILYFCQCLNLMKCKMWFSSWRWETSVANKDKSKIYNRVTQANKGIKPGITTSNVVRETSWGCSWIKLGLDIARIRNKSSNQIKCRNELAWFCDVAKCGFRNQKITLRFIYAMLYDYLTQLVNWTNYSQAYSTKLCKAQRWCAWCSNLLQPVRFCYCGQVTHTNNLIA